jgi:hypothetical protein
MSSFPDGCFSSHYEILSHSSIYGIQDENGSAAEGTESAAIAGSPGSSHWKRDLATVGSSSSDAAAPAPT